MMIIDTTVLVYAVGEDHPLAPPARALLGSVRDGAVDARTTPEVIQEFAHVRARRRSREDAVRLAQAYATLFGPLQAVSAQHLASGLALWRDNPSIGAFDAVLAAVAIAFDAELVSADRAFGKVPALRWRDLAEWAA